MVGATSERLGNIVSLAFLQFTSKNLLPWSPRGVSNRCATQAAGGHSVAFGSAGIRWVDCLESMSPILAGGVVAGAFGVVVSPLVLLSPNKSLERTCPLCRGSLRSNRVVGHAAQLMCR